MIFGLLEPNKPSLFVYRPRVSTQHLKPDKWTCSIPDIFMTSDVILAAFANTTLAVVFCAVPIYCIVRSADLLGRLDRRASDNSRTVAAPLSPRDPSWGVVVN